MEILLAEPHGFCMGVKRAIAIANDALAERQGSSTEKPRLYCLHKIVHNETVAQELSAKGMIFVNSLSEVPDGETVLFSAHGVSPALREEAKRRGLRTIDATCPFVERLHSAVRQYTEQGYMVLLIGNKRHDEVVGVAGEAPYRVIVIESETDALSMEFPEGERFVVLTQTTLSDSFIEPIIKYLRMRALNIELPDRSGVCNATTERQRAAREIAMKADEVIVLGSPTSANTNHLADVVEETGAIAHLLPDAEAVRELINTGAFRGVPIIGLTAGASTPEYVVEEAIEIIKRRFASQ